LIFTTTDADLTAPQPPNIRRQPAYVPIEKDDGRFAADRYRALARRELDTPGASSGCMPIDAAPLRVAALRGSTGSGFGRKRSRDLLQTVFDQGPCMNQNNAISRPGRTRKRTLSSSGPQTRVRQRRRRVCRSHSGRAIRPIEKPNDRLISPPCRRESIVASRPAPSRPGHRCLVTPL